MSFLIIPEEVALKVSPAAALLYGRLLGLAQQEGYCWASNDYLGNLCQGVSERTIRNWLKELRAAGFIAVPIENYNERKIVPVVIPRQEFATPPANSFLPPRQFVSAPPGKELPPPRQNSSTEVDNLTIQIEVNNSTPNTSAPTAEKSDQPSAKEVKDSEAEAKLLAMFAGFWDAYPLKVGKQPALKAYRAHRKKPPEIRDKLADGLAPWLDYWRIRNEPKYVPHAATFINQERFLEQPPPITTAPTNGRPPKSDWRKERTERVNREIAERLGFDYVPPGGSEPPKPEPPQPAEWVISG